MSELVDLVRKRGNLKGSLTRFSNYVETFDSTSSINMIELKTRLERIVSLISEFNSVQSELEIKDTETDPSEHSNERETFENNYFKAVAKAKSFIEAESSERVGDSSFAYLGTESPNSGSDRNIANISSNVKLPPIHLPSFNGNYDKWLHFHDSFTAMIHNNSQLSNTQKFYYLQSSLEGEATKTIQSIQISESNYAVAWDLLCKRFENKRAIVKSHVKAILEISEVSKESRDGLRRLLDDLEKNMRSLSSLDLPTSHWDILIIEIITPKLDFATKREWEKSVQGTQLPTYTEFVTFLSNQCNLLESIHSNKITNKINTKIPNNKNPNKRPETLTHVSAQKPSCNFCKNTTHFISRCKDFLKLEPKTRDLEIRKLKICVNCLKTGHSVRDCISSGCKLCNGRHNTLLHQDGQGFEVETDAETQQASRARPVNSNETLTTAHTLENNKVQILLSTAIIHLFDAYGNLVECRALLDSGSQSNFMTTKLCKQLNLSRERAQLPVAGLNGLTLNIKNRVIGRIKSMHNGFKADLEFLVLDKITGNIPAVSFSFEDICIPDNIKLADPQFFRASEIDVLLGAGIFFQLLCVGQIQLGKGKPILHKSQLGWIVAGPFQPKLSNSTTSLCHLITTEDELRNQIERFWKVEEFKPVTSCTHEEQECEKHFSENTTRDESGRFIVKLPLKDNYLELGESKENALRRFYTLERKLSKDSIIKKQYYDFMLEYETLGHMSVVETDSNRNENEGMRYYLPHHCVVKESSITTRLRVVFDASAKTSSGLSLNDVLKVGPIIQDDLFSILTRFRKHNYIIMADVAKMYRQVKIDETHRDLQRIFWRASPEEVLKIYKLNTVTYGTASASFLAVRCLHQISFENEEDYPLACEVIRRDFYVDDLISGSDTVENAIVLRDDLCKVLISAGFELRKWISNDQRILENLTRTNVGLSQYIISDDKSVKTLGITWIADSDCLSYTVNIKNNARDRVTKRQILSIISQIFDPLGLIGPTTIRAKILLQKLWQLKTGWDESVPADIHTAWERLQDQINVLNQIKVPRQVTLRNTVTVQLHGFCDASEIAFGACLYMRSVNERGEIFVSLLCAKSRVAPLKTVTLPRLELCGALLLANLTKKVVSALDLNISEIYYWTDSTIVLAWLNSQPSELKCFVGNRVAEIQRNTDITHWRHVNSAENPADIISRGTSPDKLIKSTLWWSGPLFLAKDTMHWPSLKEFKAETVLEKRKATSLSFVTTFELDIFERFSTLTKLQRVVAYCLRFIRSKDNSSKGEKSSLSCDELNEVLIVLVRISQHQCFPDDIEALRSGKEIPRNSRLISLNPFLDERDLLRVGGRIRNAYVGFQQKHPYLLSDKHPLTRLIIRYEHIRHLHAGVQSVLAAIRMKFWPLNAKNAIKKELRNCVVCFKARPTSINYQMGNLPENRVIPARPFHNCGVDFAGPFLMKDGRTRNRKIVKTYLCVFICFSTKAVHLELAGDLSTECFLNALKRFISRRGIPKNMYSDNGTNFVGASRKLKDEFKQLRAINRQDNVANYLNQNSISWHFIPPRAPNFGGLWEAAVKSAKYHLIRVVGDAHLTFEQLYTVITQIEAVLNSRPLTPISSDPHDMVALTPAHFLIGDTLTSLPEADLTEIPVNRLTHYERLRQLLQNFWKRWSSEYLHSLQQRTKWQLRKPNGLKAGMMVLLKGENTTPFNWILGRIIDVLPGKDGVIRVVIVKTKDGTYKRPVSKVCVMPCDDENK